MKRLPNFDSLFDGAPEAGKVKEAALPDFDQVFDALPTRHEAELLAVPEPDAFGITPTIGPRALFEGLGAGAVDLSMALPKMIAGGLGEAAQLPYHLATDPTQVGQFYKRTMEAFPIPWGQILTPEGEALRQATGLPFALPSMLGEEITPTILEHAGPEVAAAVQTALDIAPILPMVVGAGRSLGRAGKAAGKAAVEAIPEEFLFKSEAGRSWTAQEVGDILRATDEATIDPDLLRAFKELTPQEKAAAIKGAGIDITQVERTWLGKLLGKETKPPTPKPGKPKPPPEPAPGVPVGELPPGPEPAPAGAAEVAPVPPPTPPPDAKIVSTRFGTEVAARAAADAYRKNGYITDVKKEGNKWVVDRWKPTAEDLGTAIEQAPEVEAVPSPEIPVEPVPVAPPVPPQGPVEPPQPFVDRRKAAQEGPRERRKDLDLRKRIEEMTPEERAKALLHDDVTGLKTRRAWEEAEKKPRQAALDLHGLKWVNDNISHAAGDEMLRAVADAIYDAHGEGYRFSGDEFVIEGDTPDQIEGSVQKIKEILADSIIVAVLPDGTEKRFQGMTISHGQGGTLDEAFAELNRDKEAAIARGERSAERGGRPGRLAEITPARDEVEDRKPAEIQEAEVARDKEDETGVPGEIRKGEEPVETQPDLRPGPGETRPGGVLQEERPTPPERPKRPEREGAKPGVEEKPQAKRPLTKEIEGHEKIITSYLRRVGDEKGEFDEEWLFTQIYDVTGGDHENYVDSEIAREIKRRLEEKGVIVQAEGSPRHAPRFTVSKIPPGIPEHTAKFLESEGVDPFSLHVITSKAEEKEFHRRYGLPNALPTKEGHVKFGGGAELLFIDDDTGKAVAYSPGTWPSEKEPPLVGAHPEALPRRPPGDRWTVDPGAIPGEPSFFLDDGADGPAAVIVENEAGEFRALFPDGTPITSWKPLEEVAAAAEKAVDRKKEPPVPAEISKKPTTAKEKKGALPVMVSPEGKEYQLHLFAVDMKFDPKKGRVHGTGWEWFGFEKPQGDIVYGLVHGFETEWGSFSLSELKENNVRIVTDPAELHTVMPPIGWTKKEEAPPVPAEISKEPPKPPVEEAKPTATITTKGPTEGYYLWGWDKEQQLERWMPTIPERTRSVAVSAPYDDLNLFLYKDPNTEGGRGGFVLWVVHEATTGHTVTTGKTQREALDKLETLLGKHTPEEVGKRLTEVVKTRGVSPFVPEDTKEAPPPAPELEVLEGDPLALLEEWAKDWADAITFDDGKLDPSTVNVQHAETALKDAREKGLDEYPPETILEALNRNATTPNWTIEEVMELFDVADIQIGRIEGDKILIDPIKLADEFRILLKNDTMPKDRTGLKRYVASKLGIKTAELQAALETQRADWKNVEEAVEYAIVMASKDIAQDEGMGPTFKFKRIETIYNNQPLLSQRTSESILLQQYSTPAPIAYLMGRWTGLDEAEDIYEPTAGTGMLLIDANPDARIVANELDDRRASILKAQGYETYSLDATEDILGEIGIREQADVVIMNPPFGSLGKVVEVEGYRIRQRDHQIAMSALRAMRPEGKAAVILGGHNLQEGHIRESDQPFINHIYGNYNVLSNIEVNGDVYRKQGTTWPIRIILISGRKPVPIDKMIGPDELRIVKANTFDDVRRAMEETDDRPSGLLGGKSAEVSRPERPERPPRPPRPIGVRRPERGPAPTGELERPDDSGVDLTGDRPDAVTGERPPGLAERPGPGREGGTDLAGDRGGIERPRRPDVEIEVGEHQTTYVPLSRGETGNNKIPKRMADSVRKALESVQKQVGDLDDFVATKLEMPVQKLYEVLSGEQIDALALAIAQADSGMALINGDMTGVGKGRVAAAMIRYANLQGKTPLFITAMPKLFTDMWRDLTDIGHEVKPFLMHSDKDKASVYDEEGELVFKPHGNSKTYKEMLAHPGGPAGWLKANKFGLVMLPYSQVQSPTSSLQRDVLANLGPDNYAILDESHRASGQSRIGAFFREAIVRPAKGVIYLSATYAKRPDTMSLYFRTNIGATGMPIEQLTDAIVAGGVSLQQWMANALAASGQYIRRELDFTGIGFRVQTDFANKDRDANNVNQVTHVLRNILAFDRAKLAWVETLDRAEKDKERLELRGIRVSGGKQTLSSGVTSTNFAATVHNAVNQMLLAVKADEAADQAIRALKEGKKPVLNLMNTMQSFLDDLASQEGVKEGEPIDFGFHAVLKRALRNTLRLKKTDTKGKTTTIRVTPEQLPETLRIEYRRVEELIERLSNLDLPGSPIDYMIHKVQKAGYKVAEITGRATKIDYSKDVPTLGKRSAKEIADRNVPVIAFQKGKVDALIINAAGSTGLSLHASPASDKKPRLMIVLQPDLNIDTFTQALGRINRKGQVLLPEYILLQSAIPAEIRPGIVLRKKMSSLNANTSANTESGTSIDMPDMLNSYGDEVVVEFLTDNPQINDIIGNPLGIGEGQSVDKQDAFRKVTGRIALAPVAIQEKFYNAIQEMFNDKIEYLDQVGENNLRAKDYDLQAVPKRRVKIATGTNENNPLTASTYADEMSVKVLKKPFNAAKIKELVEKALEGKNPTDISNQIYAELYRRAKEYEKELEETYEGEDLVRQKRRLHGFLSRQKDVFHLPDNYKGARWAQERQWRIGDTYKIGILEDYDIQGVLIGIKLPSTEAAGSPIAPSRIKLSFAVNSSMQRVDLALSSEPAFRTQKSKMGIDKDWDKNLLTADREDRVIVTGNLLEGFGQYSGKAQVIAFTDSKGRRHDGMLLPQGKSVEDLGTAVIPWEKAFEMLAGAHASGKYASMKSAESESDQVRVQWSSGNPILIVPAPKNRGQKFWGDPDLLELTQEKRFDKSTAYSYFTKNRMVASITPENLKKALAMLTVKHGVRWTAPASIEEVKDGELPDGPGDTTLYSTPLDPELVKKSFRSLSKSVQELREAHRLAKKAKRTDLNWFNNVINTPYYVFETRFPEFSGVFERARQGFQERDDIAAELAERGMEYFQGLEFAEKEKVNKALIKGRFERTVYTHEQLDELGLTPEQKAGYFALRDMFDHALSIYEDGIIYRVTKGQIQSSSDLDLEVIAEVMKTLDYKEERAARIIELLDKIRTAKRKGYAPFTRFGDFGFGLQRIKEDGSLGEIFYWATEESAMKAARAYQKVLKRYAKSIKAGTMRPIPPREMKQKEKKALLEGVGAFELEILSRFMDLEPDTADELKQAVEHLFQESGFRKHFFESKDTPGFTTDMERASADYIIGLSGFVSRIKMIPEMDEAARGIEKYPKLALYYKTWKDYIISPQEEYHRLRSGLFIYFLGGNPKSAAINLTQTLAATVPWLSQYVSMSRALAEVTRAAKILSASLGRKEDGRVGVVLEKLPKDIREIITRGVREGVISEQLVYELMGVARKPSAMRKLSKQKQRIVRGFGFMFSTTEKINRFVAMIAAAKIHQSLMQRQAAAGGAAPPEKPPGGPPSPPAPFEQDPFEFSKRAVDETQFIYAKYNRPRAFRNFGAIFGVFRTFVINILELYARFIRRGSMRAMFAAFMMLWFLAGLKGMPFAEDLKYLIEQMVGAITHKTPDLETSVREWGYDAFGSPDFADYLLSGPNRNLTGVDIGRSVGVGDVVPLLGPDWEDPLAGIVGAPAEVLVKRPARAYGHVMEGDYYRAVESVAPEFLRNPMYAARLLREGLLDRSGAPITKKEDLTALDITAKALGFTPTRVAKAQERESAKYRIGERTARVKRDITREAQKLANEGKYEAALKTIQERAHGWRDERNRDNIIFTGKPLPKSAADWIILDEYELLRQLEESKIGPKYRGILRQPTLQRPEFLKANKYYQ